MAYKDPEMKKAKDFEYHRRNREFWKDRGRCGACGKMDAYTLAGRATCAGCLEAAKAAMRKYYVDHKAEVCERQRAWYEARKAAGLCVRCGSTLREADGQHATCAACRAERRKRRAAEARRV